MTSVNIQVVMKTPKIIPITAPTAIPSLANFFSNSSSSVGTCGDDGVISGEGLGEDGAGGELGFGIGDVGFVGAEGGATLPGGNDSQR